MLHRTRPVWLADGPLLIRPLITEFSTADAFHVSRPGYLHDLYQPTTSGDPFSPVLEFRSGSGVRYMLSAPVTMGKKCLRTPFLIDTGANWTMLHTETYSKFGTEPEHNISSNITASGTM